MEEILERQKETILNNLGLNFERAIVYLTYLDFNFNRLPGVFIEDFGKDMIDLLRNASDVNSDDTLNKVRALYKSSLIPLLR